MHWGFNLVLVSVDVSVESWGWNNLTNCSVRQQQVKRLWRISDSTSCIQGYGELNICIVGWEILFTVHIVVGKDMSSVKVFKYDENIFTNLNWCWWYSGYVEIKLDEAFLYSVMYVCEMNNLD